MEWLETAVIIVHVLVSLVLIGLVLLQQGKGAEAGASFGAGASQTVFGSQGTGNFLTKSTSYLAIIFFATSISLAVLAKQKAEVAAGEGNRLAPVEQLESSTDGSADAKDAAAVELEAASEEASAPELE